MLAMFLFVVLALLSSQAVSAYLSGHHDNKQATVDCHVYPTIMSYHVHITYMLTNQQQISAAIALRDIALDEFSDLLGSEPTCQGTVADPSGRYDNGRFCMIHDHNLRNETLGPFTVGEWSMFVPVHFYNRVVPWFVQHRQDTGENFSLLVHPNSGCEYEDHSIWAQWSGAPWTMDMSIFTPWTQTESFGKYLGTPENPVCLAHGGMCADAKSAQVYNSKAFAPQIVCCAGLNCDCASGDGHCFCK